MAEIWAAAASVVATGASLYMAHKQQSAAKKAQEAASGAPGYQPLKLPPMPQYVHQDFNKIQGHALDADRAGYAESDADFKRRHGGIVSAERLFEDQTLRDQQGESELMPAVQNEFMRAGLQNSLSAFGDTPGTLGAGSAGEAGVARNLGIDILKFQDRNRANRERSLVTAEQLFPRRQFGLSGADAAGIDVANTAGENNYNQANYANTVQQQQFNNTGQANFNNAQTAQNNYLSGVSAAADANMGKAIVSASDLAAKLGARYSTPTADYTPTATTRYTPVANPGATPNLSDRPIGWKAGLS